jgi:hypothetical protein
VAGGRFARLVCERARLRILIQEKRDIAMTTTSEKVRNRTVAILAVGAASLALAGCSLLGNVGGDTGTDTSTGTSDGGDTTDVFTIKVGDCLNDGGATGEVSEVPVVDCAEAHDSEAYASIIMDDGAFPGDTAVEDQAVSECTTEFDSFVGLDYQSSTLDFAYYYPTEASWGNGDREILCRIVDPAGKVTGSLAGAAR